MERSHLFLAVVALAAIVLTTLLFFAVVSPSPATSGWELPGNGSVEDLYIGSNDTLYTFNGNHINAILLDGTVAWTLNIPDQWVILNNWTVWRYTTNKSGVGGFYGSLPVFAEENGSLYVYAFHKTVQGNASAVSGDSMAGAPAMVMCISSTGDVVWTYHFSINVSNDYNLNPDNYLYDNPVSITVRNDRVYIFHDYGEDVLDASGTLIFRLKDIASPPAIGDDGEIYVVQTALPVHTVNKSTGTDARLMNGTVVGEDLYREEFDSAYRIPSSTVVAYSSNGSLAWERDIGFNVTRQYVARDVLREYGCMPLCWNGKLFLTVRDGIVALDKNGSILWTRQVANGTCVLFDKMPMDDRGNIYLTSISEPVDVSHIVTVSPDGIVGTLEWQYQLFTDSEHPLSGPLPVAGRSGIVYAISDGFPAVMGKGELNKLLSSQCHISSTLTAYDIMNGTVLWSFAVPADDEHRLTLTEDNVHRAISVWPYSSINESWSNVYFDIYPMETYPLMPVVKSIVQVYSGSNLTFLNYDVAVYESPVIPGRSRCVYTRGIYVLDADGRLIEKLTVDGLIRTATVDNGTIFYGTLDGKIGSNTVTIVTGLALTAIALAFFKYFLFGTVTRARGQLDRNPNRNRVLEHIVKHPGSTANDIARSLAMNLGTVRYHLLILGINHRVKEQRADGKFVRFFPNSNAYTEDERIIISLTRRSTMRRVLKALLMKPGMSNHELAGALGVSATAASNYMQELNEAGIVEKDTMPGNRVAYRIADRYKAIAESVLIKSEQ